MDDEKGLDKPRMNRRAVIKGAVGVPILGVLTWAVTETQGRRRLDPLAMLEIEPEPPRAIGPAEGEPIRLGIIGYGSRGRHLLKATGFPSRHELQHMRSGARRNPQDTRLQEFFAQDDLNVRITGVCDLFEVNAQTALETAAMKQQHPKRFKSYQELLQSPDIDAVIIATPDHWHAPIALAAAQLGKHVYVEKCMTHRIGETYALYDAVKRSGIVFQVGHQHRQTDSFLAARAILKKHYLGHISLIQATTNRNTESGAWINPIHPQASPATIDWAQFIGNGPQLAFDAERFFRWRKWWAYGTGLSGDLLTHDYDRINCLLEMGIPDSVTATGGVYVFRDGREVPDVFQVAMEFDDFTPYGAAGAGERGMTFLYSATLGSSYDRSTQLMGRDGTMELGDALIVHPEQESTRYAHWVQNAPRQPIVVQASASVDATTSASVSYFAKKGLLSTSRDGKRVDPAHLHIREWLSCIRHGGTPSCGIEEGFEEAMSSHMATLAYRLARRIEWDRDARRIRNVSERELERLGMA